MERGRSLQIREACLDPAHVVSFKRAICYSGFRDGQSPDLGIYPSVAEIRADLHLLKGQWAALRLYACDVHAERVLKVIRNDGLPFQVMLGAYVGAEVSNPNCPWGGEHDPSVLQANKRSNQLELARAAQWANEYQDIIDIVSVGNEATVDWTDHLVEPETIQQYAANLQSSIQQPVTFCENYVPWLTKLASLAEQLDLIAIHSYPVWEFKGIDEALEFTIANYEAVQSKYPHKSVIITEAGWATASNGRGIPPENVSEQAQREYLVQLLDWAKTSDVLVYLFEAFDENWKGSDHPLEPEKHWGLYTAARQPKPVVAAIAH
jgi:exo-beta-1,3-glucanase (GH17 family)